MGEAAPFTSGRNSRPSPAFPFARGVNHDDGSSRETSGDTVGAEAFPGAPVQPALYARMSIMPAPMSPFGDDLVADESAGESSES